MSKFRAVAYLLCFVLVFGVLGGLAVDGVVLAAREGGDGSFLSLSNQEEPQAEYSLKLSAEFPVLRAKSGNEFEFLVELQYNGEEDRTFELTVTAPQNWITRMQPYGEKSEISAIRIKGRQSFPEKIKVMTIPLPWALPEPGDYMVTFEAISGDIRETFELKAVVTARYEVDFYTETGRLNAEVKAGEENHVALKLRNSGSAAIENITFTSTKPEGWSITYNPEKVDSLEPGLAQDVDVVIKPPSKTIAGDYGITIRAESTETRDSLELRITVLTPTIWGWVGIIIVIVVIVGLAILFRQLGRR